jgi:hypothetical protein
MKVKSNVRAGSGQKRKGSDNPPEAPEAPEVPVVPPVSRCVGI